MNAEQPCQVSFAHRLPAGMQHIAGLLGDKPMLRLLEAYGGTRLYVPTAIRQTDTLAQLLGMRPAQRLVRAYGREYIKIPLCKPWRVEMLRHEGLSFAAIGRRLGMHEQSVQRVHGAVRTSASKLHGVPRQLKLF